MPFVDISSASVPGTQEMKPDVLIVGAGVVGLAIGWRLRREGLRVLLIDPAPAMGASYAAAGMLAPVGEFHYHEEALQSFMVHAAGLWPDFAHDVSESTGADLGYHRAGTLLVGFDTADRRALQELVEAQQQHGLPVDQLSAEELAAAEPFLSGCGQGFRAAADHQVDPRKLSAALIGALPVLPERVQAAAEHEVLLSDGRRLTAGAVVLANGLGAHDVESLGSIPLPRYRLRPVYGDILRLTSPTDQPLLRGTVRGLVRGRPVYLVPRSDGEVVLGATQREDGRAEPLAGAVLQLLRDAQALLPVVEEFSVREVTARARPGTPDNAPLLGRSDSGVIIATGFFRHGVMLAPAAAEHCVSLVNGGNEAAQSAPDAGGWAESFAPERFRQKAATGKRTGD